MRNSSPYFVQTTALAAVSLLLVSFRPPTEATAPRTSFSPPANVSELFLPFSPPAEIEGVSVLSEMAFGDVMAGSTHHVPYTDVRAASFRIECAGLKGFQRLAISFALPSQIVNGGDAIPITFGANDAAWSYSNDPASATPFDPKTGVAVRKRGNKFSVYLWVGGRIDVDQSLPANRYSNTLVLNAQIQ